MPTGLSNISVDGSIINKVTRPETQFFSGLTTKSQTGVVLPLDNITGVEVADVLPIGQIDGTSIEGIAFGFLTSTTGLAVNVTSPLPRVRRCSTSLAARPSSIRP